MVQGGQVVDSIAQNIRAAGELQLERERLERLRLPSGELPEATKREVAYISEDIQMRARSAGSSWASEVLGDLTLAPGMSRGTN